MDIQLSEMYHDLLKSYVDERGIYPFPMLAKSRGGGIGMYSIDGVNLVPKVVLKTVLDNDIDEFIYGLDRYVKDGQGVEFKDAFVGAHFKREGDKKIWAPYVVGYQNEPRVVLSYDWNNTFWNAAVSTELSSWLKVANLTI